MNNTPDKLSTDLKSAIKKYNNNIAAFKRDFEKAKELLRDNATPANTLFETKEFREIIAPLVHKAAHQDHEPKTNWLGGIHV